MGNEGQANTCVFARMHTYIGCCFGFYNFPIGFLFLQDQSPVVCTGGELSFVCHGDLSRLLLLVLLVVYEGGGV